MFTPLMAPVDFIEPDNWKQLDDVTSQLSEYAACIVEPLIQGAGGMRIYSPRYLKELARRCKEAGVYLIADEVFTGFYRTGKFFASEHADIQPDLVCLSKGITGGFLPLSVTLATEEIFEAFSGDSLANAFLHGHSYTANPIACAAANASFDLLMGPEGQRQIQQQVLWTEKYLTLFQRQKFNAFTLYNYRQLGTIAAFDVKGFDGYFSGLFSKVFAERCQKAGVLLRPLGGTIYMVPPYCITEEQIEKIFEVISKTLIEMEIP